MHVPRNMQGGHVAADFWTQYGSTNPRMCVCVKATSRVEFGAEVVGLTSNTRDMALPGHAGVTFKTTPAITPTVIESGLDEAANLEMTGIYNSDSFDQTEVLAGKWNGAEVELFVVCWDNTDLGEFVQFKGNLGEFKDYQTFFTAEGRGFIAQLSNDVNIVTQRLCRVKEFRDAECGHTAATVTIDGNDIDIVQNSDVLAQQNRAWLQISTATIDPDYITGFFNNGKIEATSGLNDGISREIASSGFTIGPGYFDLYLKRPFPLNFESGDTVQLTAGCNRTIEDCMKFGNIINRRAEDYVPGIEAANRVPSAN